MIKASQSKTIFPLHACLILFWIYEEIVHLFLVEYPSKGLIFVNSDFWLTISSTILKGAVIGLAVFFVVKKFRPLWVERFNGEEVIKSNITWIVSVIFNVVIFLSVIGYFHHSAMRFYDDTTRSAVIQLVDSMKKMNSPQLEEFKNLPPDQYINEAFNLKNKHTDWGYKYAFCLAVGQELKQAHLITFFQDAESFLADGVFKLSKKLAFTLTVFLLLEIVVLSLLKRLFNRDPAQGAGDKL